MDGPVCNSNNNKIILPSFVFCFHVEGCDGKYGGVCMPVCFCQQI